jgi:hypothetical protein
MNGAWQMTETDAREHLWSLRNLARQALRAAKLDPFTEPVSFTDLQALADHFQQACQPARDPNIPDLVPNNSSTGDAT